jgi:ABC-2 type transport system ATP-binding protein
MKILQIDHLTKQYGDFTAVDDISLSVSTGEIFGFLGPNGAGKTTTIKVMAGLLKQDGGRIVINGHDVATDPLTCKQETAYIPDRPWLYEKLTGQEYLQFIGSLYGLDRETFNRESESYLTLFDLTAWRNHLIEGYSHGMRQKLIMTSMLMLKTPLVIVDEPMVGLDPKSARIVKELFKNRASAGATIFLSTHSLEIAEELCDRIGIISEGRLLTVGTMAELRQAAGNDGLDLEAIFLELTGAWELREIIHSLREER